MKIALLAALACLSTGCVFVDAEVHAPDPREIPVPHGIGRGREVLVEMPFIEKRYEPGRCGMKKNGYNNETADVHCESPPTRFLAVLLHDALLQAGFRVIGPESDPGPTTAVVRGTLGQYFVEPKINFTINHEADIAVRLVVTTPSGLNAERLFYTKGEEDGLSFTDENLQAASDEAVKRIVRNMVVAIAELLDHYPGVGIPSATLKRRAS